MHRRQHPAGWRRSRHLAIVLVALAAILAAGCAGDSSSAQTAATATPVQPPTATAPALTGVEPGTTATATCGDQTGATLEIGQVRTGALDAWQVLPASLPLRPQPLAVAKVSANVALNAVTVDIELHPATQASQAYLCAVTARIVAYEPLPAPIPNVIRSCSDHPYLDPGGADYGGDCGTELGPPATAALRFAATAPGSTITMPIQGNAGAGKPAIFPSPDGRASHVGVVLSVPVSGVYTFDIGIWQGRAGPMQTVLVSETFDRDAVHEWSGQFCTTPAMQAQLPPPTNPPTPLLCPGGPPAIS